jgi:hypothetical protein
MFPDTGMSPDDDVTIISTAWNHWKTYHNIGTSKYTANNKSSFFGHVTVLNVLLTPTMYPKAAADKIEGK